MQPNMLAYPPPPISRLTLDVAFETPGELAAYVRRGAHYLYPCLPILVSSTYLPGGVYVALYVNGHEVSAQTFDSSAAESADGGSDANA